MTTRGRPRRDDGIENSVMIVRWPDFTMRERLVGNPGSSPTKPYPSRAVRNVVAIF